MREPLATKSIDEAFSVLRALPLPDRFRESLSDALAEQDLHQRLQKLAALARHRLSFVQTMQIDRAVLDIPRHGRAEAAHVKLGVLSSGTADHLAPAIRVAALRRDIIVDLHVTGYGQYRQELLAAGSGLSQFAPDLVLFSLSGRDLLADLALDTSKEEVKRAVLAALEQLRGLWRTARQSLMAGVLQQTFLDTTRFLFGSSDRLVAGAPFRLMTLLNEELAAAADQDGIILVDAARVSAHDGIELWFDEARWLQAKHEIAPAAAHAYGELVARVIAAQRGLSKKCLVLDLDNTLWHGVVGDDGISGIVIGQGSAVGEAHLALQKYVRQLKDRGIVLAVCSKNDPDVARQPFARHPEMLLKIDDFAVFMANWDDKAANLKRIAERLNIGLDSLVFLDDNPVERARIRQALPMVAVPELPDDVAFYARWLADAGYFESVAFTREDRQRAALYASNARRDALQESSATIDDFLASLQMHAEFRPFSDVDIPRITQLISKTNQFNTTTRRYTADQVAAFARDPDTITLQVRLIDKFGDNGLVSAVIAKRSGLYRDEMEIDTWVMSCRVFGRQLEVATMNSIVEEARRRGVRVLVGPYLPTSRNSVTRELYERLGFKKADAAAPVTGPGPGFGSVQASDGITTWFLKVSDYVAQPTYIERRDR